MRLSSLAPPLRRLARATALAVAIAAAPVAARAAGVCWSFTPSGIAFGVYDPVSGATVRAAGNIAYSCWIGTPRMSISQGSAGTYFDRTLVRGAERLAYNLFRDAACTEVWGDGNGGTYVVHGPPGEQSIPIYARIPGSQDVGPGTYSDTLVVSVNY